MSDRLNLFKKMIIKGLMQYGAPCRIVIDGHVDQSDLTTVEQALSDFEQFGLYSCATEYLQGKLIIRLGREIDHYPDKYPWANEEDRKSLKLVHEVVYSGTWDGNE